MLDLPGRIVEALASIVHAQRLLAYVHIDCGQRVVACGGHLAHYGLEAVTVGEPAVEQLYFVEGLLPLPESPFILRSVELGRGRAADLQFYADGDEVWIVILDVTRERDTTRRVQQKAYEMTLLQEKEALLNRRLEAANAALRAAQAELERSNTALEKAYARLETELAEAAAYVRSILPAPTAEPFIGDWRFVPSARLGGDCFGYHAIDAEHHAIYLLDVCGHGVGPSLLSAGALNAIRSGALAGADLRDPSSTMATVNRVFQMDRHNGLYFTLWYGVYRSADRMLSYASAGHPPSLLLRGAGERADAVDLLQGRGPPIGVMPMGSWTTRTTRIEPGDRLYVVSDGTFEVGRPDGSMMTFKDLVAYLAQAPRDDRDELDRLLAHLRREHGDDALEDDFSVVRLAF